ncbi:MULTISPECIES: (R)-mandelonitrile lyase [Streptomyces]|uniref:(R)-mandelonitrile lyase n=1 Tax=Streptomyces TaxID=1883 RepID=UPI001316EDFD|nr:MULTISPECIES: cupin domain-containing protein [Streptomyces]QGZ47745.1 cupin domain-containing protein [Streptomyces sp. QHH-9511]GGT94171.1 cupin [Streptomyces lateritius]
MEILEPQPTTKAPAEWFTGEVWFDVIHAGREPSRLRANLVRFAPSARTHWHSHALGQTLHIVSGISLIGTRDGRIIEAHPGDTIHTPPGEEHWHGATPDRFMAHLALWEGIGEGVPETTWLEEVGHDVYTGPRISAS